jgi:hypothetical protein
MLRIEHQDMGCAAVSDRKATIPIKEPAHQQIDDVSSKQPRIEGSNYPRDSPGALTAATGTRSGRSRATTLCFQGIESQI